MSGFMPKVALSQLLRENNEKYELEKAMEAVKNYEKEK